MKKLNLVLLVFGAFALQSCKHPLAIVGHGDIVDLKGSARGCTLEQYQSGHKACTENEVAGDYLVVYEATPRPGWRFVRWDGPCSPKSDFQQCRLDVPGDAVEHWDTQHPDKEIPPSVAVFQRIKGETGHLLGPGEAISGVAYETPTQKGITGRDGDFQFAEGESVTFSIGDTVLGSVPGQPQVTPFDLAGSAIPTGTQNISTALDSGDDPFHTVINIASLLSTLDHDADPENGIMIRQSVATLLEDVRLDVSQDWQSFSKNVELRHAIRQANKKGLFSKPHGVVKPAQSLQSLYASLAIDPLITGPAHLQYDDQGNVTSFEGFVTTGYETAAALFEFRYDNAGHMIQSRVSQESGVHSLNFKYDVFGNMVRYGEHYSFEYDDSDRLIRETRHRDEDGIASSSSLIFEYDKQGRLTSRESHDDVNGEPRLQYHYEYNPEGQLIQARSIVQSPSQHADAGTIRYVTRDYQYDSEGKLTHYHEETERNTEPQGYEQVRFRNYGYDLRGNLVRFEEYRNPAYDPVGERWLSKNYVYNEQDQLVWYESFLDGDISPQREPDETLLCEYDDRGKLTRYIRTGAGLDSTDERYEYDERGYLVRRVALWHRESWQYDDNGNLTQHIINRPPFARPYTGRDEMQQLTYDSDGKLIEHKNIRFSTDGAQSARGFRYEYDDRGILIRRIALEDEQSVTEYVYTGWGYLFSDLARHELVDAKKPVMPPWRWLPDKPAPETPRPDEPPDPVELVPCR